MKHNVIWLTCLSFAILLICVASFIHAEQGKVKDGYDAYWQNRIALAPENAYINDTLVLVFLVASESFDTDTATGEILTGAIRRSVAQNQNKGWLLEVGGQALVRSDNGTFQTFYNIETHLVFDLEVKEKK